MYVIILTMELITIEKWKEERDKRHGDLLIPNWEKHLHNPLSIKDMHKAIDRIHLAIKRQEKIVIYSDYDCDGIPGGVVLHDFFKKINYENFINYIPHRHKEGYGLHIKAIDGFIRNGYTLMITVDLGITNIKEVEYAEEYGINVVLTDHHLPIELAGKQILPPAYAVINTKRSDCDYEEKMLCGCATAWKLAYAFLVKYGEEFGVKPEQAKWWLDMVGISTIADMVPLTGENRLLATYGINVLNKTKRQGLLKILSDGREKLGDIDEESVSFSIAPRLNSAGRMAEPMLAFKALALTSGEEVDAAYELEMLNNQRKRDVKSANEEVSLDDLTNDNIILTGSDDWTPGILGLIAQKIVENTSKTAFVWGKGEDNLIMKGSVRSGLGVNKVNVVQAMSECSDLLLHFGGHEEAGGFAIEKSKIESFKALLNENFKPLLVDGDKKLEVIHLKAENINSNLLKSIEQYKPFGVGNTAPIFAIKDDYSVRRFGENNKHLEISFKSNPNLKAIKWNVDQVLVSKIANSAYILGNLKKDKYKGGVQLMITDIK